MLSFLRLAKLVFFWNWLLMRRGVKCKNYWFFFLLKNFPFGMDLCVPKGGLIQERQRLGSCEQRASLGDTVPSSSYKRCFVHIKYNKSHLLFLLKKANDSLWIFETNLGKGVLIFFFNFDAIFLWFASHLYTLLYILGTEQKL